MQQDLFQQPIDLDPEADPYADDREAARRLVGEFEIDEEEALDFVLALGSEDRAHKALIDRWYRDEIRLRREAA